MAVAHGRGAQYLRRWGYPVEVVGSSPETVHVVSCRNEEPLLWLQAKIAKLGIESTKRQANMSGSLYALTVKGDDVPHELVDLYVQDVASEFGDPSLRAGRVEAQVLVAPGENVVPLYPRQVRRRWRP